MAELRRTGAFDRSHLLVQAPAGTGYANPTPVDVLEVLTRGDCAAVAVGYGLLPSFLSLSKVGVALAHAAAAARRDPRGAGRTPSAAPGSCCTARASGAKVQQARHAGRARRPGPLRRRRGPVGGHARAARPADDFHALCAGESYTDRPARADPDPDARSRARACGSSSTTATRWCASGRTCCCNRPAWLPTDGTRGRNIPEEMTWKPGITWAQALRRHDVRHERQAGRLREPGPRLPRRPRCRRDGRLRPAVRCRHRRRGSRRTCGPRRSSAPQRIGEA